MQRLVDGTVGTEERRARRRGEEGRRGVVGEETRESKGVGRVPLRLDERKRDSSSVLIFSENGHSSGEPPGTILRNATFFLAGGCSRVQQHRKPPHKLADGLKLNLGSIHRRDPHVITVTFGLLTSPINHHATARSTIVAKRSTSSTGIHAARRHGRRGRLRRVILLLCLSPRRCQRANLLMASTCAKTTVCIGRRAREEGYPTLNRAGGFRLVQHKFPLKPFHDSLYFFVFNAIIQVCGALGR